MKKAIIGFITVIAIVLITVLLVSNMPNKSQNNVAKQNQSAQTTQPLNMVVIEKYTFSPSPLKVKKGTTVTWQNNDIARHNVVPDDGQPMGGPTGPLIGKGQTFQYTFQTVGTFKYHCEPHPYMHGAVEVTE